MLWFVNLSFTPLSITSDHVAHAVGCLDNNHTNSVRFVVWWSFQAPARAEFWEGRIPSETLMLLRMPSASSRTQSPRDLLPKEIPWLFGETKNSRLYSTGSISLETEKNMILIHAIPETSSDLLPYNQVSCRLLPIPCSPDTHTNTCAVIFCLHQKITGLRPPRKIPRLQSLV